MFVVVALQSTGAPVPGTTALIAASLYAGTTHRLDIAGVILAGSAGGIGGSMAGYALGRWGGWTLLERYGHRLRLTPSRLLMGQYVFAEHGGKVVFFGRFITVLRTVAAFLAGANRMPARPFVLFSSAAAIVWAVGNGLGYYFFGHALARASTPVEIALVIVFIGSLVVPGLYIRRTLSPRAVLARLHDEAQTPKEGPP